MKALISSILLFSISLAVNAKNGDGGWTSTGGGEYIVTQDNPWFMGKTPVKWCIDHGGEDKFSLSKLQAHIEILKAIRNLSSQVKSINNHISSIKEGHNGIDYDRKCGVIKDQSNQWTKDCDNGITMSDTFLYTDNCSDADIEFILGNYNNSKIKELISEYGLERFKRIAGITIRTEYSEETLRSKGFVYIAADKGEIQYSGARNVNIKGKHIWSNAENLSVNAPLPLSLENSYWNDSFYNLSLKDYALSTFMPVVAHEFGHILGMGHNKLGNLMDVDYPAEIIKAGFTFKGNFLRDSQIFSASQLEDDMNRRISFEFTLEPNDEAYSMEKDFPLAYDALVRPIEENRNINDHKKVNLKDKSFLVFDTFYKKDSGDYEHSGTLRVFVIDAKTLNYKLAREYNLLLSRIGFEKLNAVNLRYNFIVDNIIQWVFDEIQVKWIETISPSYSMTQTIPLITFNNSIYIGLISDKNNPEKSDMFFMEHKYYGSPHRFFFIDRLIGETKRQEIHFGSAQFGTNPTEKIPSPQPIFNFK